MREIKFRAWMPKESKWYKGGAVQLTAMLGNRFWLSEANSRIIELQQYTGLKDKNGVEIYEGDVVQRFNGTGYPAHKPTVVEWRQGYNYTGFSLGRNKRIEVIGNIYENPDLLAN